MVYDGVAIKVHGYVKPTNCLKQFLFREVVRLKNISINKRKLDCSLNRYSFIVMVPRPGDSKGTFSVFESSCHLLLLV